MIFPGGNMPLISVTLAVLAVVLSTSQGKIVAFHPGPAAS